MSTLQTRQPKGVPVGGQFAGIAHTESGISLTHPAFGGKYADQDGTRWSPTGTHDGIETLFATSGPVHMRLNLDENSGTVDWSVEDHTDPSAPAQAAGSGTADTLAKAKTAAKAARDQVHLYGSPGVAAGDYSPWGEVQSVQQIAPGIAQVEGDENEGFKLSPERNAGIDARWRSESGWYSAETMGHIVIASSPDVFDGAAIEEAHSVLRTYMPDEHEAVVGESPKRFGLDNYDPIKPGDSFIRDWNTLWAEKRGTHVQAINAVRSAEHEGYLEVTVAEPRESYWDTEVRNSRTLLIPRAEYKAMAEGLVPAVPRDSNYPEVQR